MSRVDRSSDVDRSSNVDFDLSAADSDPDSDEILVEPPDRLGWLSRRARVVLTILVIAAVVGALIVHALSSTSSTPTATVVTPSSSAPVIAPLLPPQPNHSASTPSSRAAACPEADDGLSLCSTSDLVPTVALAAITQHFPGARIRAKVEEDLRDVGYGSGGLWYREIRANVGRTAIVVEVRKRQGTDRSHADQRENGSGTVVLDEVVTRTTTVLVRVTTAVGRQPALHTVQQLARDSRLLAPAV